LFGEVVGLRCGTHGSIMAQFAMLRLVSWGQSPAQRHHMFRALRCLRSWLGKGLHSRGFHEKGSRWARTWCDTFL
jgi:hypothetical protein